MNIGDIVLIELILFKNGVDHPSKNGRPCLYIGEKDDVMYFIPLQSVTNKNGNIGYQIIPNGRNKLKKNSILNLHTIIEKRAQFFKINGNIRETEMETIMKIIIGYFKNVSTEQDRIVKSLAQEYIDGRNELERKNEENQGNLTKKYIDEDKKKKQDKII